jgi:uncharacterized protein YdhG (YjbR/CyaY superfamily)
MTDVEKYIAGFEPEVQQRLHTIRNIFFEMMPETKEKISYQIPAIQAGKTYLYFAAFKNHIGFYPIISLPELEEELKPFRAKNAKASLHFKHDQPLPISLIRKIIKFKSEDIIF